MGDYMKKKLILMFSAAFTVLVLTFGLSAKRFTPVFNEDIGTELPIIMYHSVLKDPQRTGKYVITPEKFESDLIYLKSNGYETVSLKQVIKYVYQGEKLPKKPILLTFDDGMYNNKEYVLPILEEYDACAIFAVVGSYTDEYTASGVTNPTYSYLKWNDIKELSETGRIEFASHSYDLHNLSAKRWGTAKNKNESSLDYISLFHQDTQKMQSEFASNCIFTPYAYAYPLGNFSKESEHVLKKTGFLSTLSCIEGINLITPNDTDCLYLLKRFNRDGRLSTESFFNKLLQK